MCRWAIDGDTRYSSHMTQGLNPDHKFIATMNESGEQDDKEKEMEENMAEVVMACTVVSLIH